MDIRPRHITRRGFLVGIASGAALVVARPTVATARALARPAALGQVPTAPVTLDEFMELSEVLTDRVGPLRDEVGVQYQAALDPAALRRLVNATIRRNNPPQNFNDVLRSGALNDPQNALTTQQILTYWYSGLVNDRTATYLEALAWDETLEDFAVPASTKIGFAKWSERP